MALKTLGAAGAYKFGTGTATDTKKILEHSSSKEFSRRNEAKNNEGDIVALVMRGMVETISETEYSTATAIGNLDATGSTATTSLEIMASNQDFVKLRTEKKVFEFGP
jgi:hypothetical protein